MYTRIHIYTYIRIQLPVLHTLIQVFRSTASSFAKQLSEDERESPPRASSTFDLEPLSLEESPEHEGLPRLILAHSSSLPSSLRLLLRLLRSFDLRFLFFSPRCVFFLYDSSHTQALPNPGFVRLSLRTRPLRPLGYGANFDFD